MRTLKVLDLFAGGGGFSVGFMLSEYKGYKFEIARALELDDYACETLENHLGPDKVIKGDITEKQIKEKVINECRDVDVIIGGPPCQTFSLAGPARSGTKEMREKLKNDPRNVLYKHFFDIVNIINPKFVVFENVEGMVSKDAHADHLSKGQVKMIELVCDELESIGYSTRVENSMTDRYQVLNAASYGVPQFRKRVIIIANRFNLENPVPEITHGPDAQSSYKTLKDAIGKLPVRLPKIDLSRMDKLKNLDVIKKNYQKTLRIFIDEIKQLSIKEQSNGENQGITTLHESLQSMYNDIKDKKTYKILNLKKFIAYYNELLEELKINQYKDTPELENHQSRTHNFRDIVIFMETKEGSNSARFMNPEHDDYNDLLDKLYPYARNKHKDTYVKHSWNRPSNTILAHMEKDGLKFIHPEQPRTFTPYEAALLQSFPEDYHFSGGRNAMYRQIGNAVPPKMAKAIGNAILKTAAKHPEIFTIQQKAYELK